MDSMRQELLREETGQRLLRRLCEDSDEIYFRRVLPDLRIDYISPSAARVTGYAPEEFYDNADLIREMLPDDWKAPYEQACQDLREDRPFPEEVVFPIRTRDGESKWLRQRNYMLRDEQGRLIALEGLAIDVTEAKAVEEELDYRLRFESLLAEVAGLLLHPGDLDARIADVLARVGGFTRCQCMVLVLFEGGGPEPSAIYEWHAQDEGRTEPGGTPSACLPWLRKRLSDPVALVVPSVAGLSGEDAEARDRFLAAGIKSLLSIPLFDGERMLGFYSLHMLHEERAWSPQDMKLFQTLGELFSSAVLRARAEQAILRARDDLELRVVERTERLRRVNNELWREMVDRHEAVKAAEHSRVLLNMLINSLDSALGLLDAQGTVLAANTNTSAALGLELHQLVGSRLFDVLGSVRPETVNNRKKAFEKVLRTGEPLALREVVRGRNLVHQLFPHTGEDGAVQTVAFLTADETERLAQERKLRESEAQLRALMDSLPLHFLVLDNERRHVMQNARSRKLVGDLTGRRVDDLEYPDRIKHFWRDMAIRALAGETVQEAYDLDIDGQVHKMECVLQPLPDPAEPTGVMVVSLDMTERQRTQERIETLSRDLLTAQESERRRIAQDLHDSLAQDLTFVKIGLESLGGGPWPALDPMVELLQKAIGSVRDLSYALHPTSLSRLGLERTIAQHCERAGRVSGHVVDFSSAGMAGVRLDPDTEINIYRIVQEGVANALHHSGADEIRVRLVASVPDILLRIEDQGRGFDVDERMSRLQTEGRMGLMNMKERARLLGGSAEVVSREGHGTRILVKIPNRSEKS